MHYSHLLDPNFDASLLARESATLKRWDRQPSSRPPTLSTIRHRRPPLQPQPGDPIPLSFYSNTDTEGGTSDRREGYTDEADLEVYSDWGFDEGEEDSVYAEGGSSAPISSIRATEADSGLKRVLPSQKSSSRRREHGRSDDAHEHASSLGSGDLGELCACRSEPVLLLPLSFGQRCFSGNPVS